MYVPYCDPLPARWPFVAYLLHCVGAFAIDNMRSLCWHPGELATGSKTDPWILLLPIYRDIHAKGAGSARRSATKKSHPLPILQWQGRNAIRSLSWRTFSCCSRRTTFAVDYPPGDHRYDAWSDRCSVCLGTEDSSAQPRCRGCDAEGQHLTRAGKRGLVQTHDKAS